MSLAIFNPQGDDSVTADDSDNAAQDDEEGEAPPPAAGEEGKWTKEPMSNSTSSSRSSPNGTPTSWHR